MWTRAAPSLVLVGVVAVAAGQVVDAEPDTGDSFLWYEQPAESWVEALPVGNGRLGAMVFGGVTEERIQLNIDSLWAGPPFPTLPDGAAEMPGVNELGDSSVVIRARLTTVAVERWSVRREALRRIKNRFDADGIEIPFPQLTVHQRND